MDLIASHFLAGSLLTWAMPIGLLLAIAIYWIVLLRRSGGGV
jgi:cytochrome c-type biogenesis protein CcmH/NrfF